MTCLQRYVVRAKCSSVHPIDVKNINLQIKKTFKKTCIKTLNYSIHSSKKYRQYESKSIILLQNTRSVQEMETLVHFAHEKCIIFLILYVFVLTTTKTRR